MIEGGNNSVIKGRRAPITVPGSGEHNVSPPTPATPAEVPKTELTRKLFVPGLPGQTELKAVPAPEDYLKPTTSEAPRATPTNLSPIKRTEFIPGGASDPNKHVRLDLKPVTPPSIQPESPPSPSQPGIRPETVQPRMDLPQPYQDLFAGRLALPTTKAELGRPLPYLNPEILNKLSPEQQVRILIYRMCDNFPCTSVAGTMTPLSVGVGNGSPFLLTVISPSWMEMVI